MSRILKAQHDCFPLNRPFRISRGTKTAADVVLVSIADSDATGRGEAVPYPRYGETIDGTLAAIDGVRALIEGGASRDELRAALPAGAARNAIDCALWDLEAKLSGDDVGSAPLHDIPTAITIVIDTPEAMARDAAALANAPVLKIKVDANDPAAQIRAVRKAAPKADLIVDPNESWDRALVEAMQPVLLEARVGLLEQPVPADEDGWLEGFVPDVPICADESVHVAADLDLIARRYQAVNVKLDKAGGLTEALDLAHAARARGLGLMTGCMVSSSLAIVPALQIAMIADFVDLDGPVWLKEDRPGGVRTENGFIHPPAAGFWGTTA